MQGVKIQRSPRPALMNWITPVLIVKDISDSMDFYERAFGFEKGQTIADADGKLVEGSMKYKGAVVIMLEKECAFGNECKSPASSGIPSPVTLMYTVIMSMNSILTHKSQEQKSFQDPRICSGGIGLLNSMTLMVIDGLLLRMLQIMILQVPRLKF